MTVAGGGRQFGRDLLPFGRRGWRQGKTSGLQRGQMPRVADRAAMRVIAGMGMIMKEFGGGILEREEACENQEREQGSAPSGCASKNSTVQCGLHGTHSLRDAPRSARVPSFAGCLAADARQFACRCLGYWPDLSFRGRPQPVD